MTVSLRRLSGADAALFQSLRLAALAEAPTAFGGDPERERLTPLDEIARNLGRAHVWGAFAGADLVGMAGLGVDPGVKKRHKGYVFYVYVAPAHRRAGVGERLMRALLDTGAAGLEAVMLSVSVGNAPARRLYEKLGFVRYGTEPRALKVDGRYVDEDLMALIRD